MQRDYYAFQRAQLSESLDKLEHAAVEFGQARDANERRAANGKKEQAANDAVRIEPHLAFLWYKAKDSAVDNSIRDAWQKTSSANAIPDAFRAAPAVESLAQLPPLSFLIHIPFSLAKPYLSKDERTFFLLDNPVRKDTVFQTPMVASTTWKGALRACLWQRGYTEHHECVIRLFGSARGSEEGQAGRLHFYTTFFDRLSIEVINPHDRVAGVGQRGPILMECVPQGGRGDLTVLYVPFGSTARSETASRSDISRDLELVAEGIQAMLITYGFGAKTSSGFGTVEENLPGNGTLTFRADLSAVATSVGVTSGPSPSALALPRYLESPARLHSDFRQADGSLVTEAVYRAIIQARGGEYSRKDSQLYDKAQKWWRQQDRQPTAASDQDLAPELAPPLKPVSTNLTFKSLPGLCDLARRVAEELRTGRGA